MACKSVVELVFLCDVKLFLWVVQKERLEQEVEIRRMRREDKKMMMMS